MERKARTILLNGAGWGAKKHPAVGEVFFLDFPLYGTYRELTRHNFPEADFWPGITSGLPVIQTRSVRPGWASNSLAEIM